MENELYAVKDCLGRQRDVLVIERYKNNVKIHYIGRLEHWDEWVNVKELVVVKSHQRLFETEQKIENEYQKNQIDDSCLKLLQQLPFGASILPKIKLRFNSRKSVSFLIIGPECVGKSTLLNGICGQQFVNVRRKINTSSINVFKESLTFSPQNTKLLADRYKNQTGVYEEKCKDNETGNLCVFDFWVCYFLFIKYFLEQGF